MHKDTRECVAVKMVNVNDSGEGLTQDNLKKEVVVALTYIYYIYLLAW